ATAQHRNDTDDVPPRRHPPNLRSSLPCSGTPAVTQRKHRHEPISLFAVARCWLHFHNLEVGHRLRRSRIRARGRGLISHEADRLSDIGIKVDRCTIDDVLYSLFVPELVFMTAAGAGKATGNCL